MTDSLSEMRDKVRRSISAEFVQMEDDFDNTRLMREKITTKIMDTIDTIKLTDSDGSLREDAGTGIALYTAALRALNDAEKARGLAITLKLKNQEQEQSSNAASQARIAIILKASSPGLIEENFPSEELEDQLAKMFDGKIEDYELRSNPRDIV